MNVKLPGAKAVADRDSRRTAIIAAAGVALLAVVLVLKMFVLSGGSSSTSSGITGGPRPAATAAGTAQRATASSPQVAPGPPLNTTRDLFRPLR